MQTYEVQGQENVFAVKQLTEHRSAETPNEVKVLEGLLKTQHQHDHLIKILATFRINGSYYLIFPWAKMDLDGYWKNKPKPPRDRATAKWLLEQCHGLACGLYGIHNWKTNTWSNLFDESSVKGSDAEHKPLTLLGRHGDIKPKNILWFDTGGAGTLKLADFGTTRFDIEGAPPSVLNITNLDVPTTPNYRAPEYDSDKPISLSWDIWALGCMYLEFITWFSSGWKGIDEFANDRLSNDSDYCDFNTTRFYVTEDGNKKIKRAVMQVNSPSAPAVGIEIEQFYAEYTMYSN